MNVILYTTKTCPFCIRAKMLLDEKAVFYEEISVDDNPSLRAEMTQKCGRTSVPQIWIDATHIGGCDELYEAEASGQLDRLLQKES